MSPGIVQQVIYLKGFILYSANDDGLEYQDRKDFKKAYIY